MFRHDLKHTGHTSIIGPEYPILSWTFQAGDGIVSSPTIGSDGTIYVGSGWSTYPGSLDNNLYALNPDGSLKWSYAANNGIFSSPALAQDGTIYFGSIDRHLYAIEDLGTHATLKWRNNFPSEFPYPWHILGSPTVGPDGTIFIGAADFFFRAVDPADGSVIWDYGSDWCIISSAAFADDGTVYVGGKDHHLFAFDSVTGTKLWDFSTGEFFDGHLVDSSPAIGPDGTIYFGTDQYGAWGKDPVPSTTNFWAVNPDGTLKWVFETGDGVESSPAIGPDGTIYFGSHDHFLYAVEDTGTEGVLRWKFETGDIVDGSPTVDGNGTIYFGSRDSKLYALNPDGTLKWSFLAGGGIESSPTIDANGNLYFGSFDGKLYCIESGVSTVNTTFSCTPSSGTVPFGTQMRGEITNKYSGLTRTIGGRLDIENANGKRYRGWKRGFTNIKRNDTYVFQFTANMPAVEQVIGTNTYTLNAYDITPAPWNQAPYPPSDATDTDTCTVVAVAAP